MLRLILISASNHITKKLKASVLFYVLFGLFIQLGFIGVLQAQNLTISSSGDSGTSGTNWSISGTTLTVTGVANIQASVIQNALVNGPLTIVGNSSSIAIDISQAITSTSGNDLRIGGTGNTVGQVNINSSITNAGSITIDGGGILQNTNAILTTTGSGKTVTLNSTVNIDFSPGNEINTNNGNVTINADSDANGSGGFFGAGLTVNPGSGDVLIRAETIPTNETANINGTGNLVVESSDAAFGAAVSNSSFVLANTLKSFTFGTSTNTANITLSSDITVNGPISVMGGVVTVNADLSSSADGDIFIKGIATNNPSISVNSGRTISKSAGTGTLTLQGHSRVINDGTISATGTGRLNVVMWSDFDNSNNDGGITHGGTTSTNGGHVWMGGSNTNGGSYTWNGLTVGDGPSIGTSGYNSNALGLTGSITTSNGHVFVWAGTGPGMNGIAAGTTGTINAGTGNITLKSDVTAGTFNLTTTGKISLVPNAGSYDSALTLGGLQSGANFSFNTSHYSGLIINNINSLGGLTIGRTEELLSSGTPEVFGNTSNVTISSALTIAGPIEVYGGNINVDQNLNTFTGSTSGNILLKGSGDVILAASRSITTNGAPVILWANSDNEAANGSIALRNGSSIVTGSGSGAGGHVWLGGGSDGATWNGLAVGSGYAVPGTSFTPSDGGGAPQAGIYLERNSISSFGGNIKIAGDGAATARGIVTYGNTININAGSGKIELDGQVNSSATGNRGGVLFGLHDSAIASTVNILSSATTGDAITINGVGRGAEDAIGLSGTLNITSSGGGNIIMNGNALGSGRSIVAGNYFHGILNVFANSGTITLNGNTKAVQVDEAVVSNGKTVGPSKINIGQGGAITSSSSDVFITADNIALAAGGIAINSSGKVTIESSSDSFASALTYPITKLTVTSTISGLTLGKATNTANITMDAATTVAGPITVYGGTIDVDANLTSTATSGTGISLNGQNIAQNVGIGVTTSGANIDYLASGFSTTSGVDNAIKIGNTVGTRASINAGGGNISLTGSFGTTSVAGSTDYGIWLFSTDVMTSGTGTITLTGDATNTLSTESAYGISMGNATVKTQSGAITLNGTGGKASGNSRGIVADAFSNKIVSVSGPITLNEIKPTGLTGTYTGLYMNPASSTNTFIGADGTDVASSSSSVTVTGDRAFFDVNSTFRNNINTSGAIVFESVANSFETAPSLTGLTISGNPSSVRLGKTTNTANITVGSAVTAAGPIDVYGGTIAVNAALTATNSNINLTASTAATQTAAITANELALNGAGDFTLQDAANNVGIIAGGDASNRLGNVAYRDADALEIGSVNPTGIFSTGTILIETENGDITLSQDINTTSTSTDAIIVNAGRASAVDTAEGGNIIVSGTPTLTYGTNGIAKLFSGIEPSSTGLTTLAGGAGNTRSPFIQGSTITPALDPDNAYAIYRVATGTGDLTIVASDGDAINTTWSFDNGVITTLSNPVNINASVVEGYLASGNLKIEAGSITVAANVTGTTANNSLVLEAEQDVIISNDIITNGPITVNANKITMGNTPGISAGESARLITTGSTSHISLLAKNGFETLANSDCIRGKIMTSGGNIHITADADNNNTGILNIDWLTIDHSTGSLLLEGAAYSWNTGSTSPGGHCPLPEIYGSGSITFRPTTTNSPQNFHTSWISLIGNKASLTLGSSTNNFQNIIFEPCTSCLGTPINGSGQTITTTNGPIEAHGFVIEIKTNLKTTGSGDDILLRAQRRLQIFDGTGSTDYRSLQANNGDIVLWTNSINEIPGGVVIGDWVTLNSANGNTNQSTGGGKIWIAGGSTVNSDGLPTGPANGGGGRSGVSFGTFSNGSTTTSLYSGGGDIYINGESNSTLGLGISWNRTGIAHAGDGTITIKGDARNASGSHGIELGAYSGSIDILSGGGNSSIPAISMEGKTARSDFSGMQTNGDRMQATGAGGISIVTVANTNGTGPSNNLGTDLLAASGDIFISAQGGTGLRYGGTIGKLTGSDVANSSSNITLRSDQISINTSISVDATGQLTVEPFGTSFANALSWPIANFSVADLSGLQLGKEGNTANITVTAAQTIAGPISVYGGDLAINENLNTTGGGADGDILLKGSGNIIQAASKTFTTTGGDVTLWADSDGNGTGYVRLLNNTSIVTSGGNITLGGGSDITTGYARGFATADASVTDATLYISGVHLNTSASLSSGGGNITLRGENEGVSNISSLQFGVWSQNASVDAGSGKVAIYGKAGGNSNAFGNSQAISNTGGWTIRSSNADPDAIHLEGDASQVNGGLTSLGINFNGTIEATGGGGVFMLGKAGTATNYDQPLDIYGNVLANSGPITLVAENNVATQTGLFFGTNATLGSKANTNVTASTSTITLKSDNTIFNATTPINTSGTVSILPLDASNSFGVEQTIGSNLVLSADVSGLTVGKAGNTANLTFGSAQTIAGPITYMVET
jgi:hypothetical protein